MQLLISLKQRFTFHFAISHIDVPGKVKFISGFGKTFSSNGSGHKTEVSDHHRKTTGSSISTGNWCHHCCS